MKKLLLLCALAGIASATPAQTKKIWHKSHSGSSSTFGKALSNSIFETGHSDFGKPNFDTVDLYFETIKLLKIEKVIKKGDTSLVVLYTKPAVKNKNKSEMAQVVVPIHKSDMPSLVSRQSVALFLKRQPEFMSNYQLNVDSTTFINFNFASKPRSSKKK